MSMNLTGEHKQHSREMNDLLELAARLADVETNYTNLKKELDEIKKKVGG